MPWPRRILSVAVPVFWVVFGIPGYVDDGEQWSRWLKLPSAVSAGNVLTGLIVLAAILALTVEIWWPRLPWSKRKVNLKRLRPTVLKCRRLIDHPVSAYDLLWNRNRPATRHAELMAELDYLSRHLTSLDIRCPDPTADSGTWSTYLTQLEVAISYNDLEGARKLGSSQSSFGES